MLLNHMTQPVLLYVTCAEQHVTWHDPAWSCMLVCFLTHDTVKGGLLGIHSICGPAVHVDTLTHTWC